MNTKDAAAADAAEQMAIATTVTNAAARALDYEDRPQTTLEKRRAEREGERRGWTKAELKNYREGSWTGQKPISPDDFRMSIAAYYDRPVEFVRDVIGAEPDGWQREFLVAVRDLRKVAAATSTGVGKSTAAAWAIIWYMVTRPYAVVVCTAPSQRLLNKVLWKELKKWIDSSSVLSHLLEWQETTVKHRYAPARWHALAKTTKAHYSENSGDMVAEGIQGEHSDFMLIVVDEASGVATPNFESLEGTMTGYENKMIVLGNPLRTEGRFYDIFSKAKFAKYWKTFRISSLPHEGAEWVSERGNQGGHAQELVDIYGEDDAYVQARVFGQFPTRQSVDTIFSVGEIADCINRSYTVEGQDDCQIGFDSARYGDDETVAMVRRGNKITRTVVRRKLDTGLKWALLKQIMFEEATITCQLNGMAATEENTRGNLPTVNIDEGEGGGGASVFDLAWAEGFFNVYGVRNDEVPNDVDAYSNLATEMWDFELKNIIGRLDLSESWGAGARQRVEKGRLVIEGGGPDEALEQQLTARKYKMTGKGTQKRLETKDEMKRRGLKSPDRADALTLAVHQPTTPDVY